MKSQKEVTSARLRELHGALSDDWKPYRMTDANTGEPFTDPEDIAEYLRNTVLKSQSETGSLDFFFVSTEKGEGSSDVAHFGNGPTSWANASGSSELRNMLPALIALSEERDRLRAACGETDLERIDEHRQLVDEIDELRTRLVDEHEGSPGVVDARLWESQCHEREWDLHDAREEIARLRECNSVSKQQDLIQRTERAEGALRAAKRLLRMDRRESHVELFDKTIEQEESLCDLRAQLAAQSEELERFRSEATE